ncbi:RNA-directed DNA polymerase from mobile element jockey-like [Plakobranchus ocellatus]|uniref:RNA-directed DNA polymerase from mobile element jockey-like n=1 Tax=Plakobranchus ocellatus TaxID=259542 RepID=A0AAV4DKP4_9GAST|nr:RNA-directed DNA polymerase from mobile element jockey-like [Plakobranchus ocellatus]
MGFFPSDFSTSGDVCIVVIEMKTYGCLRRHIEEAASSVRERTAIFQNLRNKLRRHTALYVSFIRPVLEYANPVLNLASRTSLEKLDRVQDAAVRLILGALRSTPIATLEVASRWTHHVMEEEFATNKEGVSS